MKRKPEGGAIHIEEIQDQVELALMRGGEHEVARAYVLYREKRSQERAHEKAEKGPKPEGHGDQRDRQRRRKPARPRSGSPSWCTNRATGLADVEPERILKATLKDLYDGVPMDEVRKCVVLAARTLIEKDPAYSFVTARLLLDAIRFEALGEEATQADMATQYAEYFPHFVRHGIKIGLLNEALAQYDLKRARRGAEARARPAVRLPRPADALRPLFPDRPVREFAGAGRRFELPQCFFMRVAMGLALNEVDREARAIEFYNVLSTFDFMSSTPTLFNSGTHRSQLSSCYLTTVADDLDGIYEAIKENALLSKFAGGLGNDWTNVRAHGLAHQGHQRQVAGRGAVPEGGQRHRGRGQPGRQAQGRGVHLSRDLASRHRGVPGAAQEHRRRPPPHARHEHGELDSGPVHEARDGGRRLDAVLAVRRARPARQMGPRVRGGVHALRGKGGARRTEALQEDPRAAALAQDAVDAVRDRPSVDHVQGCLQRALAAAARRRRAQLEPVHRDHAQHQRHRDRRLQPGLGEPARAHEESRQGRRRRLRARSRQAAAHDPHRDAHARQRHRHQLLRGGEGAQLQPQASSGGPWHHGLPGLPAPAAHAVRVGSRDGVRRPLDGSGLLLRLLGVDRARRGARPLQRRTRAACGTAASCRRTRSSCCARSAAATSRSTSRRRWTGMRCARASSSTACAIPIASRSPRPRRSPTSSAWRRRSSPSTRTSTSSRTCPASSPSSTSIWSPS